MTDYSLVPPRNPYATGGAAKDRRWTLIIPTSYGAQHVSLEGTSAVTHIGDLHARANKVLGFEPDWQLIEKTGAYTAPVLAEVTP